MSGEGQGSGLGRYLRRKAVRKVIERVGMAKLAAAGAVACLVFLFLLVLLAALAGAGASAPTAQGAVTCTVAGGSDSPPAPLLSIYQAAAQRFGLGPRGPGILAAINEVETDFGRSTLLGVHSGTNSAGAAGPMQFLSETWATYGADGNGDGIKDVYDETDAVFGAANYLRASGAPNDWYRAIFSYNHADWYVQKVESLAAKFSGPVVCTPEAPQVQGGNALLQNAQTLYEPRAFKPIPQGLWVAGGAPESVDSRIWPDVVWVLETYHLQVTAARETGHNTHGDGTAVDSVPAPGKGWEETAQAAAEALGWRPNCGASGSAPACPLVPAIQFIGYNGYPDHGDPAHAGSNAHLHISWQGSSFGCSAPCPPPRWVRVFPLSG